MKRTFVTALLSACLLTLSACGGVNPPITQPQTGDPKPPAPQNPFVFNPACAMAYPSVDLTPCVEADGTPIPVT